MNCELISVGTEILLGDILNTNAQFLSRELASLGFNVLFQCTVGDNRLRLLSVLENAAKRSDVIILTGGLGPTPDDITKEVCAEFCNKKLIPDKESLDKIEAFFALKNTPMPESNKKQALIPEDAIILRNDNGTAPGCIMKKGDTGLVILPGPPKEMIPMFLDSVKPYLQSLSSETILSHNIRTFGIGESAMSEKVSDLLESANPTVAPYAKNGEALLRVTAKAESREKAEALMKPLLDEINRRLGSYIYGIDANSIEETAVKLLREKNLTAAFAESCTGGLCAKRITDISGASQVFHCGIVSYSNEIKHRILGVSEENLSRYGAVSAVVAAEMALGVKKLSGASFGISVTGMAGPTSDDPDIPVGRIYIAATDGETLYLKELNTGHSSKDCRDYNRFVSASNALNELRLCALSYPEKRSEGTDIKEFINSFKEV
ncbi:MAG: competence/damage-inducible protein A [Ruminococcaceae bacterium]|nr:competence/damage-inducible protein A [Oscillospiraceae bacterium]